MQTPTGKHPLPSPTSIPQLQKEMLQTAAAAATTVTMTTTTAAATATCTANPTQPHPPNSDGPAGQQLPTSSAGVGDRTQTLKIKLPPVRKQPAKTKVDAEAKLIDAKLDPRGSPQPAVVTLDVDADSFLPSAESTPTPAHRRRPLAPLPQSQEHIPNQALRDAANRIRQERQDSAPPHLGDAKPEHDSDSDSNKSLPEECTWPKDGFSVHGNSSNETVHILDCIGEGALESEKPFNYDNIVTDGRDRHGAPIPGRALKRARTETPPEHLSSELRRRKEYTNATTDVSVKYARGRGRDRSKKQLAQGPPTTVAYLPHPPHPVTPVPKPRVERNLNALMPPRPDDLHPLYAPKQRTAEEQGKNEANYFALSMAVALEEGGLSPPPMDVDPAPAPNPPRAHSPFPTESDYFDSPPPPPPQPSQSMAPSHQGEQRQGGLSAAAAPLSADDTRVWAGPSASAPSTNAAYHAHEAQVQAPYATPASYAVHAQPPPGTPQVNAGGPQQHAYQPRDEHPPRAGQQTHPALQQHTAHHLMHQQNVAGQPHATNGPSTGYQQPVAHQQPVDPQSLNAYQPPAAHHLSAAQEAVTALGSQCNTTSNQERGPPMHIRAGNAAAPPPHDPVNFPFTFNLGTNTHLPPPPATGAHLSSDARPPQTADVGTAATPQDVPNHTPMEGVVPSWVSDEVDLTPSATTAPKRTPPPVGGWPVTHAGDPEAGVQGSDAERLEEWWANPANICVLLNVYCRLGPGRDTVWRDSEQIKQAIRDALDDQTLELTVVAPEAAANNNHDQTSTQRNGRSPRPPAPYSWFVTLPPAQQQQLLDLEVISYREVTIIVRPRTIRFPRLLLSVGFPRISLENATTVIKRTFERTEIRNTIARFILENPRRNQEPLDIAVQRIIDSISVETYEISEGTTVAKVLCDSPAATTPRWRDFRGFFDKVPFKSAFTASGNVRPVRLCRGCHMACHPTHLCPYPDILGWNGPDPRHSASGKRHLALGPLEWL